MVICPLLPLGWGEHYTILCLRNSVNFEQWSVIYIGREIFYNRSMKMLSGFYIVFIQEWSFIYMHFCSCSGTRSKIILNILSPLFLNHSHNHLCTSICCDIVTQPAYWYVIEFTWPDIRMPVTIVCLFLCYHCFVIGRSMPHIQK